MTSDQQSRNQVNTDCDKQAEAEPGLIWQGSDIVEPALDEDGPLYELLEDAGVAPYSIVPGTSPTVLIHRTHPASSSLP